ncbi:adropin [Aptenodytes patagonicus]|uniref:adropin n=1 Tax=Aptenodytes forsteri TaxID=9233 RepID=UPI0004F4A62C|nr:PREDICTED: adropin [Aptenodytes forsteri]
MPVGGGCTLEIAALASQAWGRAAGPSFSRGTVAMGAALSTGAVVAISFNCVIALLILILFLILCKACRTPSCPNKSPASDADEARNEEKYLLQP